MNVYKTNNSPQKHENYNHYNLQPSLFLLIYLFIFLEEKYDLLQASVDKLSIGEKQKRGKHSDHARQ